MNEIELVYGSSGCFFAKNVNNLKFALEQIKMASNVNTLITISKIMASFLVP